MKWASGALPSLCVHPTGTGILHSISFKQHATVMAEKDRDGATWAVVPDSQTPAANSIGVLTRGAANREAQSVRFGIPVTLRHSCIIGVRLLGRLPEGDLFTDPVLRATEWMRAPGDEGEFVGVFGPEVAALSAGDRAVATILAPDTASPRAAFPSTPLRSPTYGRRVAPGTWCRRGSRGQSQGPPDRPRRTATLDINLAALRPNLAGSCRTAWPQPT